MERCGLDRRLALGLLRRAGSRYQYVLLVTMLATFVLSLFVSNTATTPMMLAVLAPVMLQFDPDSNAGKGLPLGFAVAANLGGMGSLIGTPAPIIVRSELFRDTTPTNQRIANSFASVAAVVLVLQADKTGKTSGYKLPVFLNPHKF